MTCGRRRWRLAGPWRPSWLRRRRASGATGWTRRASSAKSPPRPRRFYHIVGAIAELERLAGAWLAAPPGSPCRPGSRGARRRGGCAARRRGRRPAWRWPARWACSRGSASPAARGTSPRTGDGAIDHDPGERRGSAAWAGRSPGGSPRPARRCAPASGRGSGTPRKSRQLGFAVQQPRHASRPGPAYRHRRGRRSAGPGARHGASGGRRRRMVSQPRALFGAAGPKKSPARSTSTRTPSVGGGAQASLHLHPDLALAGDRRLRRVLGDLRAGVGGEVVDVAGQHDARAPDAWRRRWSLSQHRQHQAPPVAVAGRVGGVDDQLRAARRGDDARRRSWRRP